MAQTGRNVGGDWQWQQSETTSRQGRFGRSQAGEAGHGEQRRAGITNARR